MKIGIDARLWSQTGVGRYIRNLVLNLQRIDIKNEYVLFVIKQDYGDVSTQIFPLRQGFEGQANSKWKIVVADIRWHTLSEQYKFVRILNKENFDLVHFPYFSLPVFYKKPYIVTIHDLIVHHFPTGKASTLPLPLYKAKRAAYKKVIRTAVKNAKKIIVPLNAVKEDLIKTLGVPQEKIIVTYEGVDDKFKIENLKLKTNKYGKYFLYVGNAYPHKNLERLIEAFEIFKEKSNNDVSLLLAGKSDFFYKRLEQNVKNQDRQGIRFLHEVSDLELSGLYSNALALLIPSLMEGFGLPAIEAMSKKCLVLASNIPSLREVCLDAAVYFDPLNTQSMASKMLDVFNQGKASYRQNIETGKKRLNLFSWKKMSEETLKIYTSAGHSTLREVPSGSDLKSLV